MKTVQIFFSEIYDAIIKNNKLEEIDDVFAHFLFTYNKDHQYGFDQGNANNIDEWIKANSSRRLALSPVSREIFNALFKLYQTNTHLMLLHELIKLAPDFGKHYQIIKVSDDPELLDLRKLKPEEPRENLTPQLLEDYCSRNNRKALAILINKGISLPMELYMGNTWDAAVMISKPDIDIAEANKIVNTVAKENLKIYEAETTKETTKRNMVEVCKEIFAVDLIKNSDNNIYFKFTFNAGEYNNIDQWLDKRAPFKDDINKRLLEPAAKETLNNLFKYYRANENLTLLHSLIEKEPDFVKQFKIVKISEHPVLFDISKKSKKEAETSDTISLQDIEKSQKMNLASATRLMNSNNIVLTLRKTEDYALPLTTPKRLNFEYRKRDNDNAKKFINSSVVKNKIISAAPLTPNNRTRQIPPNSRQIH